MGALNFEWLRESVVSFLSMTSTAGMTVARLGVEHEKNIVASFSIWEQVTDVSVYRSMCEKEEPSAHRAVV
jgi:hypothetical protein